MQIKTEKTPNNCDTKFIFDIKEFLSVFTTSSKSHNDNTKLKFFVESEKKSVTTWSTMRTGCLVINVPFEKHATAGREAMSGAVDEGGEPFLAKTRWTKCQVSGRPSREPLAQASKIYREDLIRV
ncbi:hypothetical protein HHI36_017111 [Cryptolaemus montrouzieri]|uniref:Uncharacterized protein n=1 Tax=Cryptolaemus montrouzieri TaxID=559131 RepID=A0ABD2NMQ8_9CUCU